MLRIYVLLACSPAYDISLNDERYDASFERTLGIRSASWDKLAAYVHRVLSVLLSCGAAFFTRSLSLLLPRWLFRSFLQHLGVLMSLSMLILTVNPRDWHVKNY